MEKAATPRSQQAELKALQDTIYVVGGKWTLPVINSICNGNRRFREIERSIPGITTRMLSRVLKDLELNNLVVRTVYDESPALVEYTSNEYCKTLGPVIQAMILWGQQHKHKIRSKK